MVHSNTQNTSNISNNAPNNGGNVTNNVKKQQKMSNLQETEKILELRQKAKLKKNDLIRKLKCAYRAIEVEMNHLQEGGELKSFDKPFLLSIPHQQPQIQQTPPQQSPQQPPQQPQMQQNAGYPQVYQQPIQQYPQHFSHPQQFPLPQQMPFHNIQQPMQQFFGNIQQNNYQQSMQPPMQNLQQAMPPRQFVQSPQQYFTQPISPVMTHPISPMMQQNIQQQTNMMQNIMQEIQRRVVSPVQRPQTPAQNIITTPMQHITPVQQKVTSPTTQQKLQTPNVKNDQQKVVEKQGETKQTEEKTGEQKAEDNEKEIAEKKRRAAEDELLAQEQAILQEIKEMQAQGKWTKTPIKRYEEPRRNKTHWDYLLEEAEWLAKDFVEERKWKMKLARRLAKSVQKYHQEQEKLLRKEASYVASIVQKEFWAKVRKIVEIQHQLRIDEEKNKALAKKRDYLVQKTEDFSMMLSQELEKVSQRSQTSEGPFTPQSQVSEDTSSVQSETQSLEAAMDVEEETKEDFVPTDNLDDESSIQEDDEVDEKSKEKELEELKKLQEQPLEDVLASYYGQKDKFSENEKISKAAESAGQAQPTGFTLQTTVVKTKVPFLLSPHLKLREYQLIGLDWLVTMYEKGLNGILADEMGLGKTIQTIALLAHLACEKEIWGEHLIVVPASVLLNWEIEFKRWCPSLKILSYYGSLKERKLKRQGWSKPNSFHVCITSYNVILQDHKIFKRKKWHYMILDEAHHIKNFKSKRWQTLLNFNTERRLLLTGTPLQNSVMELWSLMHFLMPHIFESHSEFKDWFSNPVTGMVEGKQSMNEQLISRLHTVLRPFILRRLKKDVEKQLPSKYEHVVYCKLSKRQRYLYEEFMQRTDVQQQLSSGSVFRILNVLMQLRKVCNHPDLFESRPIISPFSMQPIDFLTASEATKALEYDPLQNVNLKELGMKWTDNEFYTTHEVQLMKTLESPQALITALRTRYEEEAETIKITNIYSQRRKERLLREARECKERMGITNARRCNKHILHGYNCYQTLVTEKVEDLLHIVKEKEWDRSSLTKLVKQPEQRAEEMSDIIRNFVCYIPKARSRGPQLRAFHLSPSEILAQERREIQLREIGSKTLDIFRPSYIRTQTYFPDKRLLQFDCGKLVTLEKLLRKLRSEGHKCLIFTQMSRMLDILEQFLSMHGFTYLRLDGATKVERRQYLMEKFNTDPKVFCFILSTRSGGVGVNLTGADTVIFYDSDWNPAMDAQAQDRCHRIGQTKDVHIYRLISESTIEERILLKANQKRQINDVVIQSAGFTPEFLKKLDVRDFFGDQPLTKPIEIQQPIDLSEKDVERALAEAEDKEDTEALKLVQQEESSFLEEFNENEQPNEYDMLTPIQRYGLEYLQAYTLEETTQELRQLEEKAKLEEETFKKTLEEQQSKMLNRPDTPTSQISTESDEILFYKAAKEEVYKSLQVVELDLELDIYRELFEPPRKALQKKRIVKKIIFDDSPPPEETKSIASTSTEGTSRKRIKKEAPKTIKKRKLESESPKKKKKKRVTKKIPPVTTTEQVKEEEQSDESKKKRRKASISKFRDKFEKLEKIEKEEEKKDLSAEFPWKRAEDLALSKAIQMFGPTNWHLICDLVNSTLWPIPTPRSPDHCKQRYLKLTSQRKLEKNVESSLLEIGEDSKRKNFEKVVSIWYGKKKETPVTTTTPSVPKIEPSPVPFHQLQKIAKSPIDHMLRLANVDSALLDNQVLHKLPPRFQTQQRASPSRFTQPVTQSFPQQPIPQTLFSSVGDFMGSSLQETQHQPRSTGNSVILNNAANQSASIAHINQMMTGQNQYNIPIPTQHQPIPNIHQPFPMNPNTQSMMNIRMPQPFMHQNFMQPASRGMRDIRLNRLVMLALRNHPTKTHEIQQILNSTELSDDRKIELLTPYAQNPLARQPNLADNTQTKK